MKRRQVNAWELMPEDIRIETDVLDGDGHRVYRIYDVWRKRGIFLLRDFQTQRIYSHKIENLEVFRKLHWDRQCLMKCFSS